jgi:hypothetical protein
MGFGSYLRKRSASFFATGLTLLMTSSLVQALPPWYTANVGGFIGYIPAVPANGNNPAVPAVLPTVPDFYQHQDWAPQLGTGTSLNGWESRNLQPGGLAKGWCGLTAYADVFYDLTARGYTNLFRSTR